MTAEAPPVVKIGGSLARMGRATAALGEVVESDLPALVVSGGGEEVDRVRRAFLRGDREGSDAYWAAVRALDRMAARLVAAYESGDEGRVRLCADLDRCRLALGEGRTPVLTPYPVLRTVSDFPVAWETTSDSIAAWVAGRTGGELALVKARPPRRASGPGDRGPGIMAVEALVDEELVDASLPRFLAPPDAPAACWIVDGSRAGSLRRWLGGDRGRSVQVVGG